MTADIGVTIGTSRFLREIEIAARLTHPHILPLHDSGVIYDQPYYVMRYIEGESLRQRIIRLPSFSLDDALSSKFLGSCFSDKVFTLKALTNSSPGFALKPWERVAHLDYSQP